MIKDKKLWEDFERKLVENSKPDYKKNVKIFNMLYRQAVSLHVFPLKDPLQGIETKFKIAKYINKNAG